MQQKIQGVNNHLEDDADDFALKFVLSCAILLITSCSVFSDQLRFKKRICTYYGWF